MKNIIDIGCGKGAFCNYIYQKNKGTRVYGVDISAENIMYCETNKVSEKQSFIQINSENLPFDDGFFDEAYCFEVLEHIDNFPKALSEINRVLKKGGLFKLSVPAEKSEKILCSLNKDYLSQIGHKRIFRKNDILKNLTNSGFIIKKYREINAFEHLFLEILFRKNINIVDQNATMTQKIPPILRLLEFAFASEVYERIMSEKNMLKRIKKGLLIAGYPIGRLLDMIMVNKKQKIDCVKQ